MTGRTHEPAKTATREDKIDRQMKDTFPASDPPSYSGGNHIIGAPSGRESAAPAPDDPDVMDAQKKARRREKPKKKA
ncbi:MAG: hypothetical protein BGN85_06975 [Alphaproteobacteria bacterium 64-11]|nr:hypothetical protein [Alphaproteobacteria bacterium]OJU10238.1 MAG: hypothetical protein BGN85_06975 [Alphaproteobacteria bacterium 64-11]